MEPISATGIITERSRRRAWLLALLCALLLPGGAGAQEQDGERLGTGASHEVAMAPRSTLPILGPRYALVTIDIFQPLAPQADTRNLATALRVARSAEDVRVVYHPVVVSGPASSRGAEVLWEASSQGRFWPMCEALARQPEVLAAERQQDLIRLAEGMLPDVDRLRDMLKTRRHQVSISQTWTRERESTQGGAEVWVNGARLRGPLTEVQLREHVDAQRERARILKEVGVPLAEIYDHLVRDERRQRDQGVLSSLELRGVPNPRKDGVRPRVHVDVTGSPARGPRVAPVVVVFFGSLDSPRSLNQAVLLREALAGVADKVRLVFKHLPGEARAAPISVALARLPEPHFWSAYDALLARFERGGPPEAQEIERLIERAAPPSIRPSRRGPDGAALVARDVAEARRLGISAPPVLVLNGLIEAGVHSAHRLQGMIQHELQLPLIERLHTANRAARWK